MYYECIYYKVVDLQQILNKLNRLAYIYILAYTRKACSYIDPIPHFQSLPYCNYCFFSWYPYLGIYHFLTSIGVREIYYRKEDLHIPVKLISREQSAPIIILFPHRSQPLTLCTCVMVNSHPENVLFNNKAQKSTKYSACDWNRNQ